MKRRQLINKFALTVTLVVLGVNVSIYLLMRHYSIEGVEQIQIAALLTWAALIMALSIIVHRKITLPISRLTQASQEIEKGVQHWIGTAYLSKSISMHSNDEIGELASSFNHMVKVLGEKEKIRSLLGKVVSDEVASELLNKRVKVEGEERVATILFLDIRGFTRLSENMSPVDVLSMLNISFAKITEIIEQNRGVVDKYIGDAVMAVFGAPISSSNHANEAIRAAIEIVESMESINSQLTNNGLPNIDFGIGINSGKLVAGNVGSERRMNYTVIGDVVNLASRIEGLSKKYGARVIVGETTKQEAPRFQYRHMGESYVKGRDKPVSLFEPTGEA